jgi:hypothetical protein
VVAVGKSIDSRSGGAISLASGQTLTGKQKLHGIEAIVLIDMKFVENIANLLSFLCHSQIKKAISNNP